MSENEIRQQKAMLMLEHQEAKDRLAALREKALRQGRAIQEFGRWLEIEPDKRIYVAGQLNHNLPVEYLDERKYRSALSFDDALALTDEIRRAVAVETDLTHRLSRHP